MGNAITVKVSINGVPAVVPISGDQEYELLRQLLNKYMPKTAAKLNQNEIKEEEIEGEKSPSSNDFKYQPKTKAELKQLCKDESIYLGDIDTSLITDMACLFLDAKRKDFSGIELWNTSNVTTMAWMFEDAASFNQPIGIWDTSNVRDMRGMFTGATNFNQDISNWNTSNVTTMREMFLLAEAFNQDISKWDTSNVTDMATMFSHAYAFNQPIGRWNVSNVTNMHNMFSHAKSFNQRLDAWDISNVVNKPLKRREKNEPRIK